MSPFLSRVGERVRTLRAQRSMTRRALARAADLSERYLAAFEAGQGNISIGRLRQVADALGVDAADLLRRDPANGAEQVLLNDLFRGLSPNDRRIALQLLHERFANAREARGRIALVGLRGAGKTTLGRQLATHLQLPFIQLVETIERIAGMSVSEIFSLSGRAGYRRLEEKALLEALDTPGRCVIETGGSLVADPRLYNLLLRGCFVVWIKAAPEHHMQRVIDQGDLRPMADHDDAMADLRRILEAREPFYAQAHATLDTSRQDLDGCFAELVALTPPVR